MKRHQYIILATLLLVLIGAVALSMVSASPLLGSGAPTVISYQGVVNESGSPYTGTGYFKFAVVNLARKTGNEAELNLHQTNRKFMDRFQQVEKDIAAQLIRAGVAVTVFNQRSVDGILQMIRMLGAMGASPLLPNLNRASN